MTVIGEALALFSAFCWALNGTIYKIGLRYGDVVSANFVRVTLTSFGFLLIMLAKGDVIISAPNWVWPMLIVSAIFAFFFGDMLYMESIRRCGISRAVPLSSTYPLFVSLWSALIFGRLELNVVFGAMLVILSIYTIVGENGRYDPLGYVMALGGAVFWSFSITIVKVVTSYLPPEVIAGFRFAVVSVLLLPIAFGRKFDLRCVKWMAFSSVVMVVGNYAFVTALSLASAPIVSTLSALYPIIAQFFALGVRESVGLRIIVGTILAFLGVITLIMI